MNKIPFDFEDLASYEARDKARHKVKIWCTVCTIVASVIFCIVAPLINFPNNSGLVALSIFSLLMGPLVYIIIPSEKPKKVDNSTAMKQLGEELQRNIISNLSSQEDIDNLFPLECVPSLTRRNPVENDIFYLEEGVSAKDAEAIIRTEFKKVIIESKRKDMAVINVTGDPGEFQLMQCQWHKDGTIYQYQFCWVDVVGHGKTIDWTVHLNICHYEKSEGDSFYIGDDAFRGTNQWYADTPDKSQPLPFLEQFVCDAIKQAVLRYSQQSSKPSIESRGSSLADYPSMKNEAWQRLSEGREE